MRSNKYCPKCDENVKPKVTHNVIEFRPVYKCPKCGYRIH